MTEVIYRSVPELRALGEGRTIMGYAVVFESWSKDLGGFYEIIRKGAITDELVKRSDIIMNINHDDNKMVARSRNGEGTLKVEVDDKGLKFEFEAPPTQLGDELLYNIRTGNLFECSFAFALEKKGVGETWSGLNGEFEDGMARREITKIAYLFDTSVVTNGAYSATNCVSRSLRGYKIEDINIDIIKRDMDNVEKLRQLEEEIKKLREVIDEEPVEEPQEVIDEEPVEEPVEEPQEEEKEEEPKEEEKEEETEEEPVEEPKEEEETEQRQKNININKMERKFSIVKEIREAYNSGNAQINLDELNKRAAYTVADNGEAVVETEMFDILAPLYEKNVLVQAGAKYLNGLKGDCIVPVMTGVAASWISETGEVTETAGSFTQVKLSPKRISVRVPISLQLLAQDSLGVENKIRTDIVNAVNAQLEATILGAVAGSDVQPAGLFAGKEKTNIAEFADIAELEAKLEEAKINGNYTYILSPSAKAALRSTAKGTCAVGMVYENNEIDGTKALWTGHVGKGDLVVGDFSQLMIGNWGGTTIDVVRDSYYLSKGQICIIVNCYFDAAVARPEAFAFGTVNA